MPIVPWNPDVVSSLGFHFEEGEVVDPPLEVPRSRSTTQLFGWAKSASFSCQVRQDTNALCSEGPTILEIQQLLG